jgi:flagellar biogenesis protein FliO
MELIRQVLAVSAALLPLAVYLWWPRQGRVRRACGGLRENALQAVERLAVGPQHSLHLVRLSGQSLLVGTSLAGCAVLQCNAPQGKRNAWK